MMDEGKAGETSQELHTSCICELSMEAGRMEGRR